MRTSKENKTLFEILYWAFIGIAFIAQCVFTFNTTGRIGYEELAESVRNPFWFQNRLLYDGISSNIGWYGTLSFIYNIFGFSLFTGKIYRLILGLFSLICVGLIIRRFACAKKGLAVLAVCFSPTLLYFNTLQASYGLDLQYLPICLYLIVLLDSKKKKAAIMISCIVWFLIMISFLSYPSFLFYIPAFIVFFVWKLQKIGPWNYLKHLFGSVISFIIPVLFAFLYFKNNELLWYDAKTHSGLFRGAGVISLSLSNIVKNISLLGINLFEKSFGYYYEIAKVEFSDVYPIVTVLTVLSVSLFLLVRYKRYRLVLFLCFLVVFTNLLVSLPTLDPTPGLRRYTGVLASFYGMYAIVWLFIVSAKKIKSWLRIVVLLLLLFLPVHHGYAYFVNLEHLKDESRFSETLWFAQAQNPEKSLALFVDTIQKQDVKLACVDESQKPTMCRYSEIYSAIAGSCMWNRLSCKKVLAYDDKTTRLIPLSIDLWTNYYLEH